MADSGTAIDSSWEAAIKFLLTDVGGDQPSSRINYLIRHHPRPARGLICWACSQSGVPWPCPPILLAREAAWRLRLTIPHQRSASE